MNIDFYKNEDLVKELKSFIFEGDYESVEKWLVQYNIETNSYNAKSLINYINNKYTYRFFAFVPPMNNRMVIDKNYNTTTVEGFEKRVNLMLKHLPFEEQLNLLHYQVEDDFSLNHLKVLKISSGQEHILLSSLEFNNFITRLLNKEKFAELDKINEYLKTNTLDVETNNAIIIYKDKNCISNVTLNNMDSHVLQYKPVYDLLFNYTDKKFEYILSLGMDLPHKEEAISIRNKVINLVEQADQKLNYKSTRSNELQRCSEDSIEKYIKKCFYFDLQHKIPNKAEGKNRIKI